MRLTLNRRANECQCQIAETKNTPSKLIVWSNMLCDRSLPMSPIFRVFARDDLVVSKYSNFEPPFVIYFQLSKGSLPTLWRCRSALPFTSLVANLGRGVSRHALAFTDGTRLSWLDQTCPLSAPVFCHEAGWRAGWGHWESCKK